MGSNPIGDAIFVLNLRRRAYAALPAFFVPAGQTDRGDDSVFAGEGEVFDGGRLLLGVGTRRTIPAGESGVVGRIGLFPARRRRKKA